MLVGIRLGLYIRFLYMFRHVSAYSPDNWRTEGEHFTQDYTLVHCGLLEAAKLVASSVIEQ